MKTKEMKIRFDLDCMNTNARSEMENDLRDVLKKHKWEVWASGATLECNENDTRIRDLALDYKTV